MISTNPAVALDAGSSRRGAQNTTRAGERPDRGMTYRDMTTTRKRRAVVGRHPPKLTSSILVHVEKKVGCQCHTRRIAQRPRGGMWPVSGVFRRPPNAPRATWDMRCADSRDSAPAGGRLGRGAPRRRARRLRASAPTAAPPLKPRAKTRKARSMNN